MLGPVARRFALRSGRSRAAAAALAGFGLLGAGAITVEAQAQPAPAPTCAIGLLGSCLLGTPATGGSPAPGLCILVLCPPSGGAGTSTSTQTPTPTPSCTLPACLPVNPNPSCSIATDPTCILGGTPSACQTNCGGHSPNPRTNPPGTNPPGSSSQPRPSGTQLGFGGSAFGVGPGGPLGSATNNPYGLSVAAVPVVTQLSPVSGLEFGHAPILWPLFGALDLLGLLAVYAVVRRTRSARSD